MNANFAAEGRALAKQLGCKFIETSAKQRTNVDEAFDILIREIRKNEEVRDSPFASAAELDH
jgi:hypothetical protein